jgi:hypothetical protein
MRPAFAGAAAIVFLGLLAGVGAPGRSREPPPWRRPPLRRYTLPIPPRPPAPALPRMVVLAPTGIDEAMIHQARPDIDPGMIVPAPMAVPIPPAPGLRGPGGTIPRR